MPANKILLDGFARGFYVARGIPTYPFLTNGDYTTLILNREWRQRALTYFPGKQGVDRDPFETRAYLMAETEARPIGQGDAIGTQRTFAMVPGDQVTYGSRVITKPDPSTLGTIIAGPPATIGVLSYPAAGAPTTNLGTGSVYGSNIFFNNQVYSNLPGVLDNGAATGGTFTLTYKADTTAPLAYNAANITIETALNALASVISDGLTFSVANNLTSGGGLPLLQLTLTVGATSTRVLGTSSITRAGLTPNLFTTLSSTTLQLVCLANTLAITGHGLSNTNPLMVARDSGTTGIRLIAVGQWDVLNVNTISFSHFGVLLGANLAGALIRSYTPGTDRVGIRMTQKFYLPGVTAGISSPTDIPLPALLLNDADFIASMVANLTGYQTYDATELVRWNGWPIYTQTLIEINMADV